MKTEFERKEIYITNKQKAEILVIYIIISVINIITNNLQNDKGRIIKKKDMILKETNDREKKNKRS